jgi:glycosyltransferase involved in cell wall biosynthesis
MVVIPAWNEESVLPAVLDELAGALAPRAGWRYVLVVVDDGSTDATPDVARSAGATVLTLPFNLGVGGAVRAGLRFAVEQGADRVVILDADGQHAPADVTALLDALDAGADMAIGSRFLEPNDCEMGGLRRRALSLLNRIVRLATRFPATDATSGFRALDRRAVEFLADRYPVEYLADTVEVIVLLEHAGMRVVEVPVAMRPRQGGRASKRSLGLVLSYVRVLVGVAGIIVVRWGAR